MRILLNSLLLVASFTFVLGRSSYWTPYGLKPHDLWNDYTYDYDYLGNIKKSVISEEEESAETLLTPKLSTTFAIANDDVSEETTTHSNLPKDKSSSNIPKDKSSSEEITNKDYETSDIDTEEAKSFFKLFPYMRGDRIDLLRFIAGENINDFVVKKSESYLENSDIIVGENNNANKVIPSKDNEVINLTKSSEEKDDKEVNVSKKDIEELVGLIVTLSVMDDLIKISNKSPQYVDNQLKVQEVDNFLNLFSTILKKMIPGDLQTTQNVNDVEVSTPKNSSEEKDDNSKDVTTHKKDSAEDADKSNEFDVVSLISVSKTDNRQGNPNNDKYKIVETLDVLKPTSPPYLPEILSLPSSTSGNDQTLIKEYIELRHDLDSEQNNLQSNKLNLDKDFYNIYSTNYNKDGMKEFEKDILSVHENLDRIKRNIDAMQNLSSKLYFHKMITAAINDARKMSKEEIF